MANTLSSVANDAQSYADLELQTYIRGLNPNQESTFKAEEIKNAVTLVTSDKKSKYIENSKIVSGLDTDITATMYYISRSGDISNMANEVDTLTKNQLDTLDSNKGLLIRQNEINEWSNSNKLDTLFFLQLLLVTLSFISVLLFLKTIGLISGYLFTLLTTVSGILLILLLIFRYKYSVTGRNTRYWSKSRHPRQDPPAGN